MKYVGMTQKTADWLLKNSSYLKAITEELPNLIKEEDLKESVLSIGTLRISAHQSTVLCLWNTDYLSSSGYEEWGFMSLDERYGILKVTDIYEEVLERCLVVINQRLQGLLLDDRFIHRSLGNNIHSCLAGRGTKARQSSIGYLEDTIRLANYEVRSLICMGPWSGIKSGLKEITLEAGKHLPKLLESANNLLTSCLNRPAINTPVFRGLRDRFSTQSFKQLGEDEPICRTPQLEVCHTSTDISYYAADWDYWKWLEEKSSLTTTQRSIIESDLILKQPIRITGAAGSGKTLTMQLLAIQQLLNAKSINEHLRVLYVVHNAEMANTVQNRFITLGADDFIDSKSIQYLEINTLFGYSQEMLDLPGINTIDKDAYQTKIFQRDVVMESTKKIFKEQFDEVKNSPLFSQLATREGLFITVVDLICNEIGVTIKGRDLSSNKNRYVESEKPLSRFHSALSQNERKIVFDIFIDYHHTVFEEHEVLDTDDVALTLMGHLRTPLWEMKRKKYGFDFVFVDETQLFNENERSLFHFFTRGDKSYIPVVLALDEAQDIRGTVSSGFGRLGIENLSNQTLFSVHRCTKDILSLAFFVIQRTVDLFSSEFPDFTSNTVTLVPADHPLAVKPQLLIKTESSSFAKAVLKEVRILRKQNIRQVAVIIHAERYWNEVNAMLSSDTHQIPLFIQTKRGELIDPKQPIVVLTRPESVGGQEFDAVICVGLEKGLVPRNVSNHGGLSTALEQQTLREMYLSFTRARYQLVLMNSKNSIPSPIIQEAINAGLINVIE